MILVPVEAVKNTKNVASKNITGCISIFLSSLRIVINTSYYYLIKLICRWFLPALAVWINADTVTGSKLQKILLTSQRIDICFKISSWNCKFMTLCALLQVARYFKKNSKKLQQIDLRPHLTTKSPNLRIFEDKIKKNPFFSQHLKIRNS